MGLLEKYGRKKTGEKRNKQIGAKIEPSLFDDFSKHCDSLGLSVSDGIRYLIIEELNRGNTNVVSLDIQGNTQDKPLVKKDSSNSWMQGAETTIKKALNQWKIDEGLNLGNAEVEPTDNKGTTKVKPKKTRGTTKDNPLLQWTVNEQIPCPECDKWFATRKSFYRHCRNIHNTSDYVQFMQSHSKKANEMVVAQQRESEH